MTAVLVVAAVGLASSPSLARRGFGDGAGHRRRSRALGERTLDGSDNHRAHPRWGRAGTNYLRVGLATYADGIGAVVDGPSARYVSNRIFNDAGQNLFSENDVTQWGWAWGQFIDHDIGLRDETAAESTPLPFDAADPLEEFTNDFGALSFARTPAAPGSGATSPRQQVNTLSSYIDGSGVYGVSADRLEWLLDGPVDGNLANNKAQLLLTDGYLPTVAARGDGATAPPVNLMGRLRGTPDRARVAGDVRANENIALTSIHTLFAREHNRIVAALPRSLSAEARFDIARRIVGAEIQYVTFNEFLPAIGVKLPPYGGFDASVNPGLANEFATVGYRAHSMIHGEFEVDAEPGAYSAEQLAAFRAEGIEVDAETGALGVPLNAAFGNPDLLTAIGLGPFLHSLGGERQYRNDEQIDNALRSVLFKVPKPGTPDPSVCQLPTVDPACFSGVEDLGAIDIQRGRDHGMPSYAALREAYGLAPPASFTAITGEATDAFPADPELDAAKPADDPDSLDVIELRDREGNVLEVGSDEGNEDAVSAVRRTTIAARLKAVYGTLDAVDAFTGMVSEPHVPGAEFGPLQLAIWTKQFAALRDGDRFFYANDQALTEIARRYGITYRHTLAEILERNADVDVAPNVFKVEPTGA